MTDQRDADRNVAISADDPSDISHAKLTDATLDAAFETICGIRGQGSGGA